MPDEQQTGPTYEGHELPRPDEDLYDQGLAFDLETMSRRRALRFLGLGAGAVALAACGSNSASTSSTSASSGTPTSSAGTASASAAASSAASGSASVTEIPDETAGPYPGDGSNGADVLEMDGVVRSDIRSSFGDFSGTAEGVPATIELTVLDMANGDGQPGGTPPSGGPGGAGGTPPN